jgi:predicted dehydrogenase
MSSKTSRRDLIRAAGATGVLISIPGLSPGNTGKPKRDTNRLQVAAVGVGGKGTSNIEAANRLGDIVALCDVDAETRAKGLVQYPRANTFEDFREMLERMRGEIDVVIVSTPDHIHAPAAAMAMRMGKHVYVEKPLTRTIGEARKLAELAKRHRVQSQMGNQFTSDDSLRRLAAHVKAGTFGKIKEIHCWTNRAGGWWPQGVSRPASKPAPRKIDFDIWLGPSPDRPYADGYHPFAWRGWWDFGSGALGDIGCHSMNLPFMALELNNPIACQAQTSGHNRDSFPSWSIVTIDFAANNVRPEVSLKWYDGGKLPPAELAPNEKYGGNGVLMVFENDTIYAANEYGGNPKRLSGQPIPDIEFEKSPGHMDELFRAVKGGVAPMSNIPGYSGPLTETVLMGNLAVWADGPRVEWDARRLRTKGTNEYDSLIHPKYRPGWTL